MRVEEKPINQIRPYPNNPRINTGAIDECATSIRAFGFLQPLVLDTDGYVVVGHTRLEAAKRLGLETVPCVVASDLTPDEIAAYRIADNSVHDRSKWDMGLLEIELSNIEMDMGAFGFLDTFPTGEKDEADRCPTCGHKMKR